MAPAGLRFVVPIRTLGLLVASALVVGLLPMTAAQADIAVTNDQFSLGLAPEEEGSPGVPAGYIRLWDVKTAWRDINPSEGVWDWSLLDAEIEQVERAGAKTLLVLGLTPQWAARDPNAGDPRWGAGSASPPKDAGLYQDYVSKVMNRYGGRIAAVEVWNEANLKTFWAGSAEEMADLTNRAYDAVKAVHPGTKVLAASTTTRLDGPLKTFFTPYVTALKARGYPFDAWTIHSYPAGNQGPARRYYDITKWWDWVKEGSAKDPVARAKPVWDTEVNYGLKGPGNIPDQNFDDGTGSAMLARTYLDSMRAGIEATFWYLWTANFYELVGVQLDSATPQTRTAYNTVRDWTAGAFFKGCDDAVPNVVRCYFVKGDPFVVAYSNDGNAVSFDKLSSLPAQDWLGRITNPAGTSTLGNGPVKYTCSTGTDKRLCTATGALSVPVNTVSPQLADPALALGDTAVVGAGQWNNGGSTITSWGYEWFACPPGLGLSSTCVRLRERSNKYSVSNSTLVGKQLVAGVWAKNAAGASETVYAQSWPIVASHSTTVPTSFAPVKKGAEWTFPATYQQVLNWSNAVMNKVPVNVRYVPVNSIRSVPPVLADDITNYDIFKIKPAPGTVITRKAQPQEVKVYFLAQPLLQECPSGKNFRTWFNRAEGTPLRVVRDTLEKLDCNWQLWLSEPAGPVESMVTNAKMTVDPRDPTEALLNVYATKPSDSAGLSLLLGPPAPGSASVTGGLSTLNTDLQFVEFDGRVPGSVEASVIQRNTGFGIVNTTYDVYVDGRLSSSQKTGGTSIDLSVPLTRTATVIIMATVGPDRGGVTRQVYAKIDVAPGPEPGTSNYVSRVLLDGRCLASDGTVESTCHGVPSGGADQIAATLRARPDVKGLQPGYSASSVLRVMWERGNPVQVIVTNANVSPGGARYRSCNWLDAGCHLQNLGEFVGSVLSGGGSGGTAKKRKPQPVPVRQLTMPQGQATMSVGSQGCSSPAAASYMCQDVGINPGLINLDGSGLINLDGGTLINLDGGTLINLDGGTLINLDGGTLINLDGSNVVGTNGGTLQGPSVAAGLTGGQPAVNLIPSAK